MDLLSIEKRLKEQKIVFTVGKYRNKPTHVILPDQKIVFTLKRRKQYVVEHYHPEYTIIVTQKIKIPEFNKMFGISNDSYEKSKQYYLEKKLSYQEQFLINSGRVEQQIKNATKAELAFKQLLDNNNVEYKFQVPISRYICDFVLYDKLIIEIDGEYHNSDIQIRKDTHRTIDLMRLGYCLFRITNKEVFEANYPIFLKKLIYKYGKNYN